MRPVIPNCADQYGQEDHRGEKPQYPAAGLDCPFVGTQHCLPAFKTNGLGWADIDTFAAADAFMIRDMADIHLAMIYALAAADTLAVFHSDTEEGELVEQAVNGAQRAQEPAEHPEDKYRSSEQAYKQQEFPGKQGAQHGKVALVHGVGQQRNAALQGACGTDVLAERGQWDIAQGIENGDDEHKKDQDHIFSKGENPG